jgi:hypothetical protein
MKRVLVFLTSVLFVLAIACTSDKRAETQSQETASADTLSNDSSSNCVNPNSTNVAPMALGMRAMFEQMKMIRAEIEKGNGLQAGQFKMVDFINATPTDTTLLTDEFFIRAGQFKRAFNDLVQPGGNARDRYNAVLDACVNCHLENCPGPVKKINGLMFK